MRLIDADAALDRYYAEYETQDICDGSEDRDWLKKCYDDAPTLDPESLRKKGEWIDAYGEASIGMTNGVPWGDCTCSVCGDYLTGSGEYPAKGNFCPNCGADMRATEVENV